MSNTLKELNTRKQDLKMSIADAKYKGWYGDVQILEQELYEVLIEISKLTNKPKIKVRIPILTKEHYN